VLAVRTICPEGGDEPAPLADDPAGRARPAAEDPDDIFGGLVPPDIGAAFAAPAPAARSSHRVKKVTHVKAPSAVPTTEPPHAPKDWFAELLGDLMESDDADVLLASEGMGVAVDHAINCEESDLPSVTSPPDLLEPQVGSGSASSSSGVGNSNGSGSANSSSGVGSSSGSGSAVGSGSVAEIIEGLHGPRGPLDSDFLAALQYEDRSTATAWQFSDERSPFEVKLTICTLARSNGQATYKAICKRHTHCMCWITRVPEGKGNTLQTIRDLMVWGAEGRDVSVDHHQRAARKLKLSYGMLV